MKRFSLLLLSFCLSGAAAVRCEDRPDGRLIRVAVLQKAETFRLECDGPFRAVETESGDASEFPAGDALQAMAGENGIRLGERTLPFKEIRIEPHDPEKALKVNGKKYRGALIVKKNAGRVLTVINVLDLDAYLYGILPMEVSPSWPPESLKAQAVVSRTYALSNLQRHGSEGFNLCSRVHCQVYGGLDGEKEPTNLAVDETRNEVLTYAGKEISAVFFSNCGGRTESPQNVWKTQSSPPYLKSVRCRYCRNGPHYAWTSTLSGEEIVRSLAKTGRTLELPVKSVQIQSTVKSGRARSIKIRHAGGAETLRASDFRMALGPDRLRSTLLTGIKKTKAGIRFQGQGWGHGVGFCQEGGKGLAEKGAGYKKILRFYYPGTRLEKREE